MNDSFATLGVLSQVARLKETVDIGGMKTTKEFVVTTLMLPSLPKIQASFGPEGLGRKIIKLFKKELQVGDKGFDDMVYVATDTPAETAAFLQSDDVRSTIMTAVFGDGSIEIVGQKLVAKFPGKDTHEDPALVRFVQVLLAP